MTVPLRLPDERGGWWHAFVCPVHGVELEHDGLLSGAFPDNGARCPYGCRVDSPDVRGAWTALAHQACAREIRRLAASDPAACVRLLCEYADRFEQLTAGGEHEDARSWMLRGRLFHQALSEAIWAVTIGNAACDLAEKGVRVPERAHTMLGSLSANARAARTKLVADGRFTSNYTAWLLAAEAVADQAGGRRPRDEWPGELEAHVRAAVRDDGWEWEGSTYYHGFVLRAYLLALRGTPLSSLSGDVRARPGAMVRVLDDVTSPGGIRPELHDGPGARPATEHEWQELHLLAAPLRAHGDDRRVGVTRVFPDAGYVVVRGGGVHAIVDAGPHGGSHGHRDKLSLYLYGVQARWQPDPGQVPYASALRSYYASTAAHPAFIVDGGEQAECSGRIVRADDRSVTIECTAAYDDVHAVREIIGTERYLLDVLTVSASRARRIAALLRPAVAFEARPAPGGLVRTWWRADDETLCGWHVASAPAEFAVRPIPGLPDDPQRARPAVDWVAETDVVRFVSLYQAQDQSQEERDA